MLRTDGLVTHERPGALAGASGLFLFGLWEAASYAG